jgi:putative transposase
VLPTPALLRLAFLWSETRMVSKTATVSLFGYVYEFHASLAGRRCELLFDPFDLTRIEVRYQDRPFGLARPVRIGRHTHPKAKTMIEPPAAPTGIDYLGLLAAQRDAELVGDRIDYAQIAEPEPDLAPEADDEEGER